MQVKAFGGVQGHMKDKTLTQRWNLLKTGVSTDSFTPLGAMLMGGSVFLYAFIQVLHSLLPLSNNMQLVADVVWHRQETGCIDAKWSWQSWY